MQINVRIKIWFLTTAGRYKIKRKQGIEFVFMIDTSDDSECWAMVFFEQSAIIFFKWLLILFKINACLKFLEGIQRW